MARARILIIDDDQHLRLLVARVLKREDYEVFEASTGKEGLEKVRTKNIHVVICDVGLPDYNGIELTKLIKTEAPAVEVIQLTAMGKIEDGVKSVKNGAFDYLTKGDDNHRMLPLLERATDKAKAQLKVFRVERANVKKYGFDQIIGESPKIKKVIRLAKQVASTDTTVLITGQTGTGKEVFANAIHYSSKRKSEPYVAINCAAFSKELLESEMFGHVAGAFTGANRAKRGLFEEANGGTIFLDELGEMDLSLQAKLLRVLENGSFIKVGSTVETKVDVRILAATNRNLLEESNEGRFRIDLYYRLNTFSFELPSLKERQQDIILLARSFIASLAVGMGRKPISMDRDFEQALLRAEWKGNVRELRNFLERALILAEGSKLTAADIPDNFEADHAPTLGNTANSIADLPAVSLADVERLHIDRVMEMTDGNKSRTAELLGIGLTTLYRKLDEYQLKGKY